MEQVKSSNEYEKPHGLFLFISPSLLTCIPLFLPPRYFPINPPPFFFSSFMQHCLGFTSVKKRLNFSINLRNISILSRNFSNSEAQNIAPPFSCKHCSTPSQGTLRREGCYRGLYQAISTLVSSPLRKN